MHRHAPEFIDTKGEHEWLFKAFIRILRTRFSDSDRVNYEKAAMIFFFNYNLDVELFWATKEVQADLRRLQQLLKDLKATFEHLPPAVQRQMEWLTFDAPFVGQKDDEISAFKAFDALENVCWGADKLLALIDEGIAFATQGTKPGTRDLRAFRAVDSLARICHFHPELISVPKHMGEAGEFYRLVFDTFLLLKIETDPVTAFRSWRRHKGSKADKN
ncbi:MAG: hypothetical protein AAF329_27250 [Cyanobacteria bacterium P01_A01_bin.17]